MNDTRVSEYTNNLVAVVASVQAIAPHVSGISSETQLVGSQAIVDSIGFVTLLVDLEQRLGNAVDLSTAFVSHDSTAEEQNPFETVGSLATYIGRLRSSGA